MATLQESAQSILNEKNSKVLPENIVAGVTMFGVEGKAEINKPSNYYTYDGNMEISTDNPVGQQTVLVRHSISEDARLGDYIYFTSVTVSTGTGTALGKIVTALDYDLYVEFINFTLDGVDTSDATAENWDIVSGKTAYVAGEKITGTLSSFDEVGIGYNGYNIAVRDENYREGWYDENNIEISKNFDGGKGLISSDTTLYATVGYSEVANAIGLSADQIVLGSTVLGVEGTADISGVDTTDATAAAEDIAKDKTAYVNGEKITGTHVELDTSDATASYADIMEGKTAYVDGRKITGWIKNKGHLTITPSTTLQTLSEGYISGGTVNPVTAEIDANILPENIRAGVTILNVTGTAESGEGGIKIFASQDELNAAESTAGDMAIVYGDTTRDMLQTDKLTSFVLPQKVVFDTPFSGSLDIWPGDMHIRMYSSGMEIEINYNYYEYSSSDNGKTYIADFTAPKEINLTSAFSISASDWSDYIAPFFQVKTKAFEGIYESDGTKYSLAPNQLTLTGANQLVPGIQAYGSTGVITGDGSIYTEMNYNQALQILGYTPYKQHTLTYSYPANNTDFYVETLAEPEYTAKNLVYTLKYNNKYSNTEGYKVLRTKYVDIMFKHNGTETEFKVYNKHMELLYTTSVTSKYEIRIDNYNCSPVYDDENEICYMVASYDSNYYSGARSSVFCLKISKTSLECQTYATTDMIAGTYANGKYYFIGASAKNKRELYSIENNIVTQLSADTMSSSETGSGKMYVGSDGYIYGIGADRYNYSGDNGVLYIINATTGELVNKEVDVKSTTLCRGLNNLGDIYKIAYNSSTGDHDLYKFNAGEATLIKSSAAAYASGDGRYFASEDGNVIFASLGSDRINTTTISNMIDRAVTTTILGKMNPYASLPIVEYTINPNFIEFTIQSAESTGGMGVVDGRLYFNRKISTTGDTLLPFNDGSMFKMLINNEDVVEKESVIVEVNGEGGEPSAYYIMPGTTYTSVENPAGLEWPIPTSVFPNIKVGDFVIYEDTQIQDSTATTTIKTGYAIAIVTAVNDSDATTVVQEFVEVEIPEGGIDTSDATATCADILAGKTAYVNGQLIEGEIMDLDVAHGLTNNFYDNDDLLLVVEGTAFDSGYITGDHTTLSLDTNKLALAEAVGLTADKIVEGNTILGIEGTATVGEGGIDTSDATATAAQILKSATAYVNGEKITGTIESALTTTISCDPKRFGNAIQMTVWGLDNKYVPQGTKITCSADFRFLAPVLGITADKIKKGEVICGVTGTYEPDYSDTLTPAEYTEAEGKMNNLFGEEVTE